jgi:glycosyltransferase involved in cell wall biosynthesis
LAHRDSLSSPFLEASNLTIYNMFPSQLILHARVVTGHGGGPDKTIVTAPRHYRSFGFDGQCLYLHPPGDVGFEVIRRRAEHQSADLYEIEDCGPLDPRVVWQAWRLCRRLRPMIWHGHDYKTNLLGLMLVRAGCPLRLVTTVHGWVKETARTPLYYRIDKLCLPRYEHVYCVSQDQMDACLGIGVSQDRLFLLDNGIDLDAYRRRRDPVAARGDWLPVASGETLVGAMGRLSPEKGFDILIRAVARRIAAGDRLRLVIAGEGDERGKLERLICELGMQNHIRLIGFCEDVIRFYEAIDLFVLSSRREGLPNVLLEAMAIGIPVLSTRVAGVPRLISQDENGWLVDCGDVDRLTECLGRMAAEPQTLKRLGEAGRATVQRQFSFEERARKQCELYKRLLGHGMELSTVSP